MAIIPGVTLSELWRTIGYAEDALRVVSLYVVIIGLLGMLVSLYTALAERRREMAVLRAVGAGPSRIILLLALESGFLSMAGAIVGVLLVYVLSFLSQPLAERHFGLFIPI
jgi:putative ABC transport system permease protein